MEKIKDLEWFILVAEHNGFSAAAKTLDVSPAAVSQRIAKMEGRLGVKLFKRNTRRVQLTEAGSIMYERGKYLIEELTQTENAVSEIGNVIQGEIHIDAPVTYATRKLGKILAQFSKSHPLIQLNVHLNDELDDVKVQGVDFSIRIGNLKNSSLIAQKIASVQLLAVASPNYIKKHGVPQHPDELVNHSGIHYSNLRKRTYWRFHHNKQGEVSPDVPIVFNSNNGELMLDACKQGLGVAILADFICEEAIRNHEVVQVLSGWQLEKYGVYVLYTDRQLPAKAKTLIDWLKRLL